MRDWSPLLVARQRVGRFTGETGAAEDAYYAFFADDEGTLAGWWGAARAALRRLTSQTGHRPPKTGHAVLRYDGERPSRRRPA